MPITTEGNIMVGGVLASCYASVDHDLSHSQMTAIFWFPKIIEWIFGGENGWHNYAKIADILGRWLVPTIY